MSRAVLIDYGCHSFSYRLATHLEDLGISIRYFVNGSIESPNLSSLAGWMHARPEMVRNISCEQSYGKVSLIGRLRGEVEWAGHCTEALETESPAVVIASAVPLIPLLRIQAWALKRGIPFIYWLQDLQGEAMREVLGRRFGFAGRMAGDFASFLEKRALARSNMVITITPSHEEHVPASVLRSGRHTLLENWANIEEIPELPADNEWARRHGLDRTTNILYSGTLGLKHDLEMFYSLAAALRGRADTRVVIVSSGQAADQIGREARARGLSNLLLLPFQPYEAVPQVLASAAVLIASHERSESSFCVPSKILSYMCAGRPIVIAINRNNPAATMIERAGAGLVVGCGEQENFTSAVTSLIDDAEMRRTRGRSARTFAESTFAMERVIPRFLDILNSAGCNLSGIQQAPMASGEALTATNLS